ncbi:hypothetical protein SDC9_188207 [bioreactor metagenome]|uniref:Uncharacterized protein n=1 Tax=bioreactor metagenome TaxID=1076179 RepID=A0A645HR01_9ZZZZ
MHIVRTTQPDRGAGAQCKAFECGVIAVGDDHVQLTLLERLHQKRAAFHMDVDQHAGKFQCDLFQHRWQQSVGNIMRCAYAHQSFQMLISKAAERFIVNRQHSLGITEQALAMLGQALLPALFFKQRVAHFVFQPLHLLGDGRLSAAQLHGCSGKALLAGNGRQRA